MPVIVIGAGMAGCAAARRLEAAGIKVIVLEARLRICGRAHSETWRQIDTGGGGGGGGASSTTATAGSSSAANGRVCVPECTVDVGEQIIQGYTRTNPMHRMINSNRFKVVQVQHGIRTSALLPHYRTNSAADGSVGNGANVNMGVHQPSPAAAAAPAAESCLSMPDNQGDLNPQVDPAVMDDVYKLLAKIRKALIYFTPLQSGSRSARDRPRRQSTGDASLPAAPAYPDSTAADTFDVVKALVLAEGGHPPLTPLQDALMASVRARFLGAPMPLELMSWHAVQWLLRLQVEAPVLESPVLTPATSELNAAVTIQAAAAAAATAADPSALYYPPLSRLKVDPSAFVVGGVGNLLKKALAPPNVVLGAAVTEVRAGKQTINAGGPTGYKAKKVDVFRVKCTNGHVHTGSHVLVTVPLGVLQGRVPEAKIAFHPPLSRRKRVAIDKLGYGTINKAILQFDPQVVGKIFPRTPTFHCTDPRFEFYNLDVLSFEANGLISVTIHATAASERAAAKKSAEIQKAAKEAVAKAKERVAEERREQQQLYLDSIKAGTGVSPSSSSPLPKKYPGLKMSAAAAATSAAAAAMTQVAAGVDVAHLGTDVRTVETIVGLLRQMFGADVPMPIRSKVTAWQTDPYAGNGNQAFRAVGSTADDVRDIDDFSTLFLFFFYSWTTGRDNRPCHPLPLTGGSAHSTSCPLGISCPLGSVAKLSHLC